MILPLFCDVAPLFPACSFSVCLRIVIIAVLQDYIYIVPCVLHEYIIGFVCLSSKQKDD
jgi:hypothetical protein